VARGQDFSSCCLRRFLGHAILDQLDCPHGADAADIANQWEPCRPAKSPFFKDANAPKGLGYPPF
jgi:hypothetical protein